LDGTAHYSLFIGGDSGFSHEIGCSLCDFSGTFTEAIHIDDDGTRAQLSLSQAVIGGNINIVNALEVMIAASEIGATSITSNGVIHIVGSHAIGGSVTVGGSGAQYCAGNDSNLVCTLPLLLSGTSLAMAQNSQPTDAFRGVAGGAPSNPFRPGKRPTVAKPYYGLFDYYAVAPYNPGYAYRHVPTMPPANARPAQRRRASFLLSGPERDLSFHHDTDPPMNPLPHQGSHARQRREALIERGRANHPSYVKSYIEHGRRLRAKGLLK
jgi:hypothetical protein